MGLVDNYRKKKAQKASELPDDKSKIEALGSIADEENRTTVICSLENDDLKLKLLSEITNQDFRSKIICSLRSDEEKIKLLNTLPYDWHLGNVVLSLSTYELVEEYGDLSHDASWEGRWGRRLDELKPEYEKRQARLAQQRENNQNTQKNSKTTKELEDMSIEELESESSRLDKMLQTNSQEISDSERKMQLIADITAKRATIAQQNEQIAELHHQIDLQPSKSQQLGD